MKKIEIYEKAINEGIAEQNINHTLFWAYKHTQEAGNDLIDLSDVIWEDDVPEIVAECRRHGIEYITVSSTFSGLLTIIQEFENHGCKLESMTQVYSRYEDFMTGEKKIIPALKIKM